MSEVNLVEVFQDTQKQVESPDFRTIAITLKKNMSQMGVPIPRNFVTEINIQNLDTVSAGNALSVAGKTALLNMASSTCPGGGVMNGAQAQEECLFRCSDLHVTVNEQYYPLADNEGLYTTNAIFFKDKDYNTVQPFVADVITVAALNMNRDSIGSIPYMEAMIPKIRLIFQLANENNVDNLVLGAWGCGVFKNDPRTMADMFIQELKSYMGCFKQVVFAVINDQNSTGNNFEVFKDVIEQYKKTIADAIKKDDKPVKKVLPSPN